MGPLKRRKPLSDWSPREIADEVVAAYVEPNERYVRAAVVLHQDAGRLPKEMAARARAEAAAAGEPFEGLPPFLVFYFDFDDEDRPDVLVGGCHSNLVRGWDPANSIKAAHGLALNWTGPAGEEFPFPNIPGIYQVALFECVTGSERQWNELLLMWFFPGEQLVPHRQYPPPVDKDIEVALMPETVGRELYVRMLESPLLCPNLLEDAEALAPTDQAPPGTSGTGKRSSSTGPGKTTYRW